MAEEFEVVEYLASMAEEFEVVEYLASMAEEFEESEIIFQENVAEDDCNEVCNFRVNSGESQTNKVKRKMVEKNKIMSRNSWLRRVDSDRDGDDEEIVPPHVIVGRLVAAKMMAFSICAGNRRILKGRELSETRNSILRLTGFLET